MSDIDWSKYPELRLAIESESPEHEAAHMADLRRLIADVRADEGSRIKRDKQECQCVECKHLRQLEEYKKEEKL